MRLYLPFSLLAVFTVAIAQDNDNLLEIHEQEFFKRGIERFSNYLYETVEKNKESKNENTVLSSLSAHICLSMTALGALDQTYWTMKRFLSLPGRPNLIKKYYQPLMTRLSEIESVEISNALFSATGVQINQDYKQNMTTVFKAEAQQVNFVDTANAVKSINNWASEKTHNKIKEIVTLDSISGDTQMFIANAVYFKGTWQNAFTETDTQPFVSEDGSRTSVPTMYKTEEVNYGTFGSGNASFIEMPYNADGLLMLIILPTNGVPLRQVEQEISTMGLSRIRRSASRQSVQLSLPKFTATNTHKLKNVLEKMGMTNVFDTTSANFRGIANMNLQLTDVVQKTFIQVNELGTEAAAVTGSEVSDRIGNFDVMFDVNRPFHFKIIGDTDNLEFFSGSIKHIESNI